MKNNKTVRDSRNELTMTTAKKNWTVPEVTDINIAGGPLVFPYEASVYNYEPSSAS